MAFAIRDALLSQTKALPAGAATVYSTGFNLGHGAKGDFLANAELLLEVPALATGVLGDAATIKYSLQHDTDPAFGTVADLLPVVLTQTGAGGAGCAAASLTVRLPVDVKPYVRWKAVKSASGDASGSVLTESIRT